MSRPYDFATPIPNILGDIDQKKIRNALIQQEQDQQLNALAIRTQQGDMNAKNALASALQGTYQTPEARRNALIAADPFTAMDILGSEQDRALRDREAGQRDRDLDMTEDQMIRQGQAELSRRMLEGLQVARARPEGERVGVLRTYLGGTPLAELFDEDTELTDLAIDDALTGLLGPEEVTAGSSLIGRGGEVLSTAPKPAERVPPPPVIQTGEGVMQYNYDTGRYDIRAGGLAPTTRTQGGTVSGLPDDMPDDWRNLIERALTSIQVPSRREAPAALMRRLWEEGNTGELQGVIKSSVINNLNVAQQNEVMGRESAVYALDALDELIDDMKEAGIDTNILAGTFEEVERKLGSTSDPKLVEFKNRILPALMAYRLSVTGVQFSQEESLQYESLYPNYSQTYTVNKAAIRGLRDGMNIQNEFFWRQMLGDRGAELLGIRKLTGNTQPGPQSRGGGTDAPSAADPLGILGGQ